MVIDQKNYKSNDLFGFIFLNDENIADLKVYRFLDMQ